MAKLLDLPIELIDNVAENLLPHTIETFALSCKAIYSKCMFALKKHHDYREKYRIWSNRGPRRDDVFYFLTAIETDPLIAEYVQTLSFWDRRPDENIRRLRRKLGANWRTWKSCPKLDMVMSMVETKLGAYLEALFFDTEYWYSALRTEVNPQNFHDGEFIPEANIDNRSFGFYCPLIVLCLLPNLQQLALHPEFADDLHDPDAHAPLEAIRRLFRFSLNPYPLPYRPLKKLETLLPCQSDSNDEITPLERIHPFLELPALKNVYSTSGVYEPGDYEHLDEMDENFNIVHARPAIFEADQGRGTLELRRLELYNSCLSPHGLGVMIHQCTQLEVLRYIHTPKRDGIGDNWDVGACVKVLRNKVGRSLKQLYLRLRFDVNQLESAISGFEDFTALEKLETDVLLFTDTIGCKDSPNSLASMLPPSIRSVKLHFKNEDKPGWIAPLVDGLDAARKDRLSNLKEVSLQNYTSYMSKGRPMTRTKDSYAEIQWLAECEGVRWIDSTVNPRIDQWDGWPTDYREMFASCIEQEWYDDDSDDGNNDESGDDNSDEFGDDMWMRPIMSTTSEAANPIGLGHGG